MNPVNEINMDAWSSGQISSKLWLNQMAEKYLPPNTWEVYILGGWYGVLSFMLLSRERLKISRITNLDIDEFACAQSNKVNDMWVYKNIYKTITVDINTYSFEKQDSENSLYINTSTEHMTHNQWWENIASNSWVILQSTDMKHPEHCNTVSSIGQLKHKYFMSEYIYSGSHFVDYNNESSFTRYMLIGRK